MNTSTANEFIPLTVREIKKDTDHRRVRIYSSGVYDLFHYGHVEQLRQAKETFTNSYLVVGVITDEECIKYKGGLTVMTHEERIKTVSLCPYVDEIVTHPPLNFTVEFCDLVAHDADPYERRDENGEIVGDIFTPFKEADRFLETKRTPFISTTDIVHRIISRHEEYKKRNEKRGAMCIRESCKS